MNGIREQMKVIGSDGEHIGRVDYVDGTDKIWLDKSDPASGGRAHVIPVEWVEIVEDGVYLSKSSLDVRKQWETAA